MQCLVEKSDGFALNIFNVNVLFQVQTIYELSHRWRNKCCVCGMFLLWLWIIMRYVIHDRHSLSRRTLLDGCLEALRGLSYCRAPQSLESGSLGNHLMAWHRPPSHIPANALLWSKLWKPSSWCCRCFSIRTCQMKRCSTEPGTKPVCCPASSSPTVV